MQMTTLKTFFHLLERSRKIKSWTQCIKTLRNQEDYDKNMILKFLYPNLVVVLANEDTLRTFRKTLA